MLNLTLLGTGGEMPMPDRFLSALIINYKGRKILMDCGEGTQVAMRKMGVGFKSLDIICITHTHGDHIFGLPGLLSTMGNSGRRERVTITGPDGIREVLEGLMRAIKYLPFELHVIESPDEPLAVVSSDDGLRVDECVESKKNEMKISTIELDHSSPCIGYSFNLARKARFIPEKAALNGVPMEIWGRLQNGETVMLGDRIYEPSMVLGENRRGIKLSYITDTRPVAAIPAFIRDSDLFICEGTYGDDGDMDRAVKNKHMTFREAASLAREGDVKELLLTHFSNSMHNPDDYRRSAEDVFKDTIIGHDGLTKTVHF